MAVVSLNTAKVTDAVRIVRDIQSAPRLRSADVFLLQEVANEDTKASVADQMAHKLGYFVAFSPAAPGVFDQGLAIVSRYPILDVEIKRLKECNLRFRSRQRFALAANLRTPWGDVRVWNAHLDTRINSEERAEQLAPVIEDASKHTGPRLIGGESQHQRSTLGGQCRAAARRAESWTGDPAGDGAARVRHTVRKCRDDVPRFPTPTGLDLHQGSGAGSVERRAGAVFRSLRHLDAGAHSGDLNAYSSGIDIGRLSPAFPVTPPDIRVRIRRFGGLSYRPTANLGIPSESK